MQAPQRTAPWAAPSCARLMRKLVRQWGHWVTKLSVMRRSVRNRALVYPSRGLGRQALGAFDAADAYPAVLDRGRIEVEGVCISRANFLGLLGEDAVPTGAHGIGRARQAAHQGAVGQAGQGARLHAGGADIGHGNLPEQLTKTVHLFVQQAAHGLGRAVAGRETGAAGHQHHLHAILGNPLRNLSADFVQVILE